MTNERTEERIVGKFAPERDGMTKFKRKAALIFGAVFTALLGYLFAGARAPLDTYPFSVTLVASITSNPIFAVFGIIIRLIFSGDGRAAIFPYCAAACIVCAGRYATALVFFDKTSKPVRGRLCDNIAVRVIFSVFGVVSAIFISALMSGYDTYLLVRGAFAVCCDGALTFLLTSVFDRRYSFSPASDAGAAAILFITVLSLSGSYVFSVSPAYIVAFAATLYCGYSGGASKGCAIGFLSGLACGGGLCTELALFGLCGGLFFTVGTVAASAAALASAICYGVISGGTDKTLTFLPEALVGSVIITIPAILRLLPEQTPDESKTGVLLCRSLTDKKREEENIQKIGLLSDAMDALSQMVRSISDKMRRPGEESLAEMCKAVCREKCSGCNSVCRFRDADDAECDGAFKTIVSRLMTSGRTDAEGIEELTMAKCPRRDEIISALNSRAAKMAEHALKYDKTRIFAFDYESMAKILSSAAVQSSTEYPADRLLSERLRKNLLRAGVAADTVLVCGDRKKYVVATGSRLFSTSVGEDDIRAICDHTCGVRFSPPEFMMENGCMALAAESEKIIGTEFFSKQLEKQGENVCGDEVATAKSREGYFYAFICDGMGSGEQAALAAKISKIFLRQMLSCGNDKTTTLNMLNMFLKNKGGECFATVDLVEVDLHLGTAFFIKSGAAPSYVMRGGSLFRIASGTLPVGILDSVSAEMTEFRLQIGDVIVMVSDGIAGDFEVEPGSDPSWFADFLCREWTEDLPTMTEKILVAAQRRGRRSDDMTAALIRICPADVGEVSSPTAEYNKMLPV